MTLSQKSQTILPFCLYCCLFTWWVSDHAFFWDTVQLASKHAHWYYEQGFQSFFLPTSINSGHPPIFGMYLAFCWLLFGKSLLVSHFSMLPFLLGIIWLLYEIGSYFNNESNVKYLILLVLIDPFFVCYCILVSPDIVLIFAFLWCIYGILKVNYFIIIFSTILLGLISMRGMMVTFSLYIWWCFKRIFLQKTFVYSVQNILKILFNHIRPFLPAGLIASAFLVVHYLHFGWIGYHHDSPWAGSFESVDFMGFLKNIGILGWRFLDFGRLFLLGGLSWLLFKVIRNFDLAKTSKTVQLISLICILSILLTPSLLLHKGLLSHRYLLPITLTITFLFYHLCFQIIVSKQVQKVVFSIAFIGLLTGNLWIYPKHIAQGWDATLAHVPYYHLRKKMIAYIEKQQISPTKIGTVFPNIGPYEIYDLNEQQTGFVKKNFETNEYFFYATVFNDVSDEALRDLATNWEIVQQYESFGVVVILYKKD
ncbi:MAG: hypothetical protein AB8G86_05440 [Saprospiraceae bacterium]